MDYCIKIGLIGISPFKCGVDYLVISRYMYLYKEWGKTIVVVEKLKSKNNSNLSGARL